MPAAGRVRNSLDQDALLPFPEPRFSLWHLMVLMTAACILAATSSLVGPAVSLLLMAVALMALPAVGPLISDLGRQRGSKSLEDLGNALTWLWLGLMIAFLVLWLMAIGFSVPRE